MEICSEPCWFSSGYWKVWLLLAPPWFPEAPLSFMEVCGGSAWFALAVGRLWLPETPLQSVDVCSGFGWFALLEDYMEAAYIFSEHTSRTPGC